MRRLQLALAVGAVAYVLLIALSNIGCGIRFFTRADNVIGFVLVAVAAGALFWASRGDALQHRLAGMAGSGMLVGLWLWPSSSLLFVPFAIAGCLRLPTPPLAVAAGLALAVAGILVGHELPLTAQQLMTANATSCP